MPWVRPGSQRPASPLGLKLAREVVAGVREQGWITYSADIRAGKGVRLLAPYGRALRSLMWVDARPDASVVMGLGTKVDTAVRRARRRASAEPLPMNLQAGPVEGRVPPEFHFTFHASGVIHSGGPTTYRQATSAPGPHQLCTIDFAHPMCFPAVQPRARDVVLPDALRDEEAVRGRLTITPEDGAVFFEGIPRQTAVLLRCLSGSGAPLLTLQVSLLHCRPRWTSDTTVTWVSQDGWRHGFGDRGAVPGTQPGTHISPAVEGPTKRDPS